MTQGSEILKFLPLGLILLGLACLLVAGLTQVSPRKGWARLSASLLVGAAFVAGSISQMVKQHRIWPGAVGLGGGVFLAYVGLRKHERDPDGKTPAASML
jgi:uncharacterized membrane protein YgdD (TMEM256/DUF423 family)